MHNATLKLGYEILSKRIFGVAKLLHIFLLSLIVSINYFSRVGACGFIHEWPTEDTLRHYGLSEVQIEKIKASIDTLLKIKDSLYKEKEREYDNLAKLIEAEKADKIKIRTSRERIEKLWAGILRNDVRFLLEMRKMLPPPLYKRVKGFFKIGAPHKWRDRYKKEGK